MGKDLEETVGDIRRRAEEALARCEAVLTARPPERLLIFSFCVQDLPWSLKIVLALCRLRDYHEEAGSTGVLEQIEAALRGEGPGDE